MRNEENGEEEREREGSKILMSKIIIKGDTI